MNESGLNFDFAKFSLHKIFKFFVLKGFQKHPKMETYFLLREQDPKQTVTEYIVLSFTLTFIAIQIAELLRCMLCHTGDLGSRLDTLDDIETEKNLSISPNCFLALKFISLNIQDWGTSMSPGQ